ncbi:MAG: hypothetical protein ACRDK9_05655 [Solirubrobacterales bacterium]
MEASGTPTPDPGATQGPPPPPPPAAPPEDEPSGGWRALAVVLALALAFACAVMVIAMLDIGDTPTCDDVLSGEAPLPDDGECFEGSSEQKGASLVLGWPSGVLAGIAALLAVYFAASGRMGRLLVQLTAVAIVLGGVSILVGSV